MTLPVLVRPSAEVDLLNAQEWYEAQRTGLGAEFRDAVDALFQRLAESPRLYPVVHRDYRRAVLRGFPYLVYFGVSPEAVTVIACLHGMRHPREFIARL